MAQNQSALANINNQQKKAMSYATQVAQAKGLGTQGYDQYVQSQLYNNYQNQAIQQKAAFRNDVMTNQNLQQEVANNSNRAFADYTEALANAQENNTLNQETLNNLQKEYFGYMNDLDMNAARRATESVIGEATTNNYSADTTNPRHYSYDLNGQNVQVDFGKDNNVGRNFTMSIGNETYKVQLGKDITSDFGELANSMKVGEIKEVTYNGNKRMVIKDTDGKVRIIANRGAGSGVGFNRVISRIFNTYGTYGLGWIGSDQDKKLQAAYNNANNQ